MTTMNTTTRPVAMDVVRNVAGRACRYIHFVDGFVSLKAVDRFIIGGLYRVEELRENFDAVLYCENYDVVKVRYFRTTHLTDGRILFEVVCEYPW